MSQTENLDRKIASLSQEEKQLLAEGVNIYIIQAFQEIVKSKEGNTVWSKLDSETKAHIRRWVAIEQLRAERRE
jgi:hypothetical protein